MMYEHTAIHETFIGKRRWRRRTSRSIDFFFYILFPGREPAQAKNKHRHENRGDIFEVSCARYSRSKYYISLAAYDTFTMFTRGPIKRTSGRRTYAHVIMILNHGIYTATDAHTGKFNNRIIYRKIKTNVVRITYALRAPRIGGTRPSDEPCAIGMCTQDKRVSKGLLQVHTPFPSIVCYT